MTLPFNMPKLDLAYGRVTEVGHPDGDFQVRILLHGHTGPDDQEYELWARVAVPVAGDGYGSVLLPGVDDEVIVGFVGGSMNRPVVLGSLYHGSAAPPEDPVEGGAVKRWGLQGRGGTKVMLDESGSSTVVVETSGGVKVEVTDEGQKVTCTNGSDSVTIEPSGITIQSAAKVSVEASQVQVTAGMVQVDAGISKFSGVVSCDVLQTNTVISTTYTPGAGNIW